MSRWELLVQVAAGGMTDALIFAAPAESPTASKRRPFFSVRSSRADAGACAALAQGMRCDYGSILPDWLIWGHRGRQLTCCNGFMLLWWATVLPRL